MDWLTQTRIFMRRLESAKVSGQAARRSRDGETKCRFTRKLVQPHTALPRSSFLENRLLDWPEADLEPETYEPSSQFSLRHVCNPEKFWLVLPASRRRRLASFVLQRPQWIHTRSFECRN